MLMALRSATEVDLAGEVALLASEDASALASARAVAREA